MRTSCIWFQFTTFDCICIILNIGFYISTSIHAGIILSVKSMFSYQSMNIISSVYISSEVISLSSKTIKISENEYNWNSQCLSLSLYTTQLRRIRFFVIFSVFLVPSEFIRLRQDTAVEIVAESFEILFRSWFDRRTDKGETCSLLCRCLLLLSYLCWRLLSAVNPSLLQVDSYRPFVLVVFSVEGELSDVRARFCSNWPYKL